VTLEPRKGRILRAVVSGYVEFCEPIGSEWLASHFDFGCKPATLRNEMAEMSEQGYLVQPHTSAGRIPSHQGYRYYVDRLMNPEQPAGPSDTDVPGGRFPSADVEALVQQTCRMLADMTQYPCVASPPAAETAELRRLYVSVASPRHLLLVLLLSTGHVEHRVIELSKVPDNQALERAANVLNEALGGHSLHDVAHSKPAAVPPQARQDRALVERLRAAVVDAARVLTRSRVYLEGTGHILRQREFQDVLRLESLLQVLASQSLLFEVFSLALVASGVSVLIGEESQVEAMHECSVVASPYRIAGRMGGFIGVFGPTRMRYDHTVAAVAMMARSLSDLLTRASIA
jgi:heat-inducible transcriptional repressor